LTVSRGPAKQQVVLAFQLIQTAFQFVYPGITSRDDKTGMNVSSKSETINQVSLLVIPAHSLMSPMDCEDISIRENSPTAPSEKGDCTLN
ncbi:hypothetical protein SB766_26495, partial [Pseudomonas sp. SIMBA_077]